MTDLTYWHWIIVVVFVAALIWAHNAGQPAEDELAHMLDIDPLIQPMAVQQPATVAAASRPSAPRQMAEDYDYNYYGAGASLIASGFGFDDDD